MMEKEKNFDLQYFPADYADSRHRFNNQVRRLAGPQQAGAWQIPGLRDDDLFVDHVYLPPLENAKTLFVITSGIHGLEGYAGAAAQLMLVETILPKLDRKSAGVFVVHSMNPFGFKHHRRATEAHVNLNRNFSASGEIYRLRNEGSRLLNERFVPKKPVDSLESFLVRSMRTMGEEILFEDVSQDQFVKLVCSGQFELANHLEYGGAGPEPQTRHLTDWLRRTMPEYQDIVLLDLHTGLGHSGRLHLLTSGASEDIDESLFNELFDPIRDEEVYEFTPAEADGFYETYGSLNQVFPELAEPNQRVCAITMEFGTLGHDMKARVESLNRWMIEHQGIHYGYADGKFEAEARRAYLEKFFPSDEVWRSKVIVASRELFTRVFTRAGALR